MASIYIWNLKLILPKMTNKQIHEWSSLKSWKARKYHPQNLPSSPDPVFWVIPQQFRRWGVYDLWQTILLDFPSFGSKSWSDEEISRLSSGTYNIHRHFPVLVLSGGRTWETPFLFWGQVAVDLDLDRMLCSLVQGSGWSLLLELVMHIL